jgi:hypothetical protein
MTKPEQPDVVKIFSHGKLIYTLHVTKPSVQIIRAPIVTKSVRTRVYSNRTVK